MLPPGATVVKVGWEDNPWFPEELERYRQFLLSTDPDAYDHIFMGEPKKHSAARVLNGKYVQAPFVPIPGVWNGPYYGLDFGFSVDPTALVRFWIHDYKLFIEHEVWGVGIEINDMPARFDVIPEARKYVIKADCARPESVSYLQKHGYPKVVSCKKWKGSVEDGIAFLRSFQQIIIHPRCPRTYDEAKLWSYKVDRLTGNVLPDLLDGN